MAETGVASMAGSQGNSDSENGKKRIKSSEEEEEEEDRISSLPDFVIHHILSFLPATDLLKTSVLSKWWNYQWTHVPVLNFVPKVGMSPENFSNFVDKTLILHDCSNIHKFKIKLQYSPDDYHDFPNLNLWIRFAVRRNVKELILNTNDDTDYFALPEFLFNSCSLVKLKLSGFLFLNFGEVNWGSVKSLRLYSCDLNDGAIEDSLSGSPLLECLELRNCECFLVPVLVIASKSLKTLVLDGINGANTVIVISCPNLERLRVSGWTSFTFLKLMNLPSSVYATLDFEMMHDDCINLVRQIFRQVQHLEKLEVGHRLMQWRSRLERSTKESFEAPR